MARDDWRIRVELPEEHGAERLLNHLGLGLGSEARELARDLEARRLAVSRDEETVFIYTSSGLEAEQARKVVEAVLREHELAPRRLVVEHWLEEDERWDDDAPAADVDDDLLQRGYAPWEVRVECESVGEARKLADELERDGYGVARGFNFVIAGTSTYDDAVRLARRVHGDVEPGGELAWEVAPQNPFAVFGGLGG